MIGPLWVHIGRGDVRAICVVRDGELVRLVILDEGDDERPLIQATLDTSEIAELIRNLKSCVSG